ncbi:MAG: hypothetical protein DCC71_20425 [Proteobacteria bacterium]|nr:MAG: hypothetical protein DCC71_20425 [Pseudomonadota bacterium]
MQLTPLARHAEVDTRTDADYLAALERPPLTDPHMMLYGPHVGQAIWKLYLAIDWTHQLHEQTYDILMSERVPWQEKARWTERTVRNYLARQPGIARSPAPLDVTMRRAGVMMKPYFTLFRNRYPASNDFFYVAHWWHPVIYEAVMIAGNDAEQDESVLATHALTEQVLAERPQRMLLSRENMPRYARLSPAAANVFDNLHMLHGIAYDVLAYEGWSIEEKRREIERVVAAMAEQPGDEQLARRFDLPYPGMDPRRYADWMRPAEGAMTRMMLEMLEEMWPMMSPDGAATPPAEVVEQAKKKLAPGLQPGEIDGSLMDALKELVPGMRMAPESMQPGATPRRMIDAMLAGWQRRHGDTREVEPFPMDEDPALPAVGHARAPR